MPSKARCRSTQRATTNTWPTAGVVSALCEIATRAGLARAHVYCARLSSPLPSCLWRRSCLHVRLAAWQKRRYNASTMSCDCCRTQNVKRQLLICMRCYVQMESKLSRRVLQCAAASFYCRCCCYACCCCHSLPAAAKRAHRVSRPRTSRSGRGHSSLLAARMRTWLHPCPRSRMWLLRPCQPSNSTARAAPSRIQRTQRGTGEDAQRTRHTMLSTTHGMR